jgi:hypothetical protein
VLACKCLHRRRASDRAFLRLFQARQPTHLLDFFIIGHCIPHPVFVSMPTLRHPDKALVSVLVRTFKIVPDSEGVWVRGDRPAPVPWLRCHGRDRDPPPARLDYFEALLLHENGEDASCYCTDVDYNDDGWSGTMHVSTRLFDVSWTVCSCACGKLATPPERVSMSTFLAGGKLYILA